MDPFLAAHRVCRGFFLIGSPLSPISIRDQMVRGRMLIDRALQHRVIDRNSPILIVGAGAAGATAAIHAARKGINVWLVDQSLAPFQVQARSPTRWLDPTQYDWPLAHWNASRYPFRAPMMPLPWTADFANHIALGWTLRLNMAIRAFPRRLTALYGTKILSITRGNRKRLDVVLTPPGSSPFVMPFGFVLWAAGFGVETCEIKGPSGNFRGVPFWSQDCYSFPNCGVPTGTAKILIAGAGDGALQDFLRILTGCRSAKAIYRQLGPVPDSIANRIHNAEDDALRSWSWADGTAHDHVIQDKLHREHDAAAVDALNVPPIWNALDVLFSRPRWTKPDILLAFRCSHLTSYYGLNRFLTLLLTHFLKKRGDIASISDLLRFGVSVTDVRSVNHTCNPTNPHACHGQMHEITLTDHTDCGLAPGTNTSTHRANVVIIRYGIDQSSAAAPLPRHLLNLTRLQRARHLLPYHVL